jgi:hypothetical protein
LCRHVNQSNSLDDVPRDHCTSATNLPHTRKHLQENLHLRSWRLSPLLATQLMQLRDSLKWRGIDVPSTHRHTPE